MYKNKTILLTVLLFSTIFAFLLTACETEAPEPSASIADITLAITKSSEIMFPEMVEKKLSDAETYYHGMTMSIIDDTSYRINPAGANPDEIAIFKTKSTENTPELKRFLQTYASEKKKEWQDYQPGEVHKFDNVIIESKGNYTVLFICENPEKALEIFNGYFS